MGVMVAVSVALMAAGCDLTTRRIPNLLTYPAILVGLWLWASSTGWGGMVTGLGGLVVAAVPLLFGFAMRLGVGGGDVKLMAALGACLGWPLAAEMLMDTFLVGAAWAVLTAARRAWRGGHASAREALRTSVPFAPFAAAGTLWALTLPVGWMALPAGRMP